MLKIATAFSGGLAALEFSMKYEYIEHEVVFACEWDKYARKQYLQFHNEPKTFYLDISDLNANKYYRLIDLFCFGSPCQDLSLAGRRDGFEGKKSSLFREGARVLKEMMPKAFIFENVKGLLSSNNGNDFKEVIKTFRDMGYHITYQGMNAKHYGTAQNRDRIFIVGFLDVNEYHDFNFENKIKLTKVLKDYLDDEVDEKYYLSDKMISGFNNKPNKNFTFNPLNKHTQYSSCITARYYKMAITDPYIKESDELIQIGNIDLKGHNSLYGCVYSPNGVGSCLNANGGGAGAKTGLYQVQISQNNKRWSIFPFRIRRLTPKECFRLMGVKDEDINIIVSDTQAYKCAGNGIEVNTIRSILRSLYKPKKLKISLFDFI